jgi:hypothetical protein
MDWLKFKPPIWAVCLSVILLIASFGLKVQHDELLQSHEGAGQASQLADLVDAPLMYAKVSPVIHSHLPECICTD